ncbi:hypothetical protein [Hafnia paralvei]|jgi:surface antigen|uniref:hypothetical protein n=1 Tax=Hafnia paralvei TaxID=546367 RepID=UPI00187D3192|nr:hypothetical protein [Hafnia paralvei]
MPGYYLTLTPKPMARLVSKNAPFSHVAFSARGVCSVIHQVVDVKNPAAAGLAEMLAKY